jgi:hypothetical protein
VDEEEDGEHAQRNASAETAFLEARRAKEWHEGEEDTGVRKDLFQNTQTEDKHSFV